jgi:hypothetical protein
MAQPPAVTNFIVTDQTYRTINLQWDLITPITLITNYHLYVELDAITRSNMITRPRVSNTHTINDYPFGGGPFLVPNTLYYITIRGHLNGAPLGPETQISHRTSELLAPQGIFSPTQTTTTITTNWEQYEDYAVLTNLEFFIDTFDPPTTSTLFSKAATTRNVGGLQPNTLYYINLTALIAEAGQPTYTSPPATLQVATRTAPPTNLIASNATFTSITISWTNPVQAPTNILLAISTTPGVFTNSVTLDPGIATYVWTGLDQGTTYYFRVVNVNVTGVETAGIFANLATLTVDPVQSILYTGITASGFTANFTYGATLPDEIGYRIGTTNPPTGDYTYIARAPELAFTDKIEETFYYLQVVARIGVDDSTPLVAGVFTSNAIPTNFTPSSAPTDTTITMGWDVSPAPTTGYEIWISLEEGVFTDPPVTLGVVQTYQFTELQPETEYFFKLVDLGTASPSPPAFSVAETAAAPSVNPENFLMYIYKATDGFKHSAHSPQRSIRRPVLRQVRGGW